MRGEGEGEGEKKSKIGNRLLPCMVQIDSLYFNNPFIFPASPFIIKCLPCWLLLFVVLFGGFFYKHER